MCDDADQFYRRYGNIFTVTHPSIDLDVISIVERGRKPEYEEILTLIEKHQPDVLLLDEGLLASYAQEGKLSSLEEMIAEDKFDLAEYTPGVIESLRAKGNGTLYALAPHFTVPVLYYNRGLFEENQIKLPHNKMSWQEVFDLSKRFEGMGAGENRVFGLSLDVMDTTDILRHISRTFSLSLFDTKAEKLLIHSDGWKRAVELATDAVRSKIVPFSNYYTDFINGKAAMVVAQPWMISHCKTYGIKNLDWDMVTLPVDPKNPDESPHVQLEESCAIPAASPNKRAAWEFIKFINGPEMAKALSEYGLLPTRSPFLKEMDGKSMDPFYMLKPTSQTSYYGWYHRNVPREFSNSFTPLLEDALKAIVDNKKTVDEALAELEVKGQDALAIARTAKKKEKSSGTKATTGS
ncbi:periplasmic protein [Paenibacillus popilliae ATCC 14706]|uniref:Periplasmic protein n=2 Tax=Paenibacillus popilliae TaxID=78057 RepID=M9M3T6_PAEPP|nr:periplasmic protein [Paenibacillus popilliae ATCC 14706]